LATNIVTTSNEDWRCGETWFVGVNALPNDGAGRIAGAILPWGELGLEPVMLHRAQLSVVRAGYPKPSVAESDAAFRFRLNHDSAHLDGLIAEGPNKRRRVVEPHRWIVGLALNDADEGASPLVVWEGSQTIMRQELFTALRDLPEAEWGTVDVTDAYQAARKRVFAECPRVVVPGRVGEAVILHRLLVHGVAPWAEGAQAKDPGRMIAYFRPLMNSVSDWLLGS